MKITEKQLLMLFEILRDSLCIYSSGHQFSYDLKDRIKLADDIVSQQQDDLVNVKGRKEHDV